jgi:hypothetical protein
MKDGSPRFDHLVLRLLSIVLDGGVGESNPLALTLELDSCSCPQVVAVRVGRGSGSESGTFV